MPTIFRWNIARREQLGRLVEGTSGNDVPVILDEVRRCAARVIAMAGDSRLIFVGRSPENLYDYLTGAFAGTSWSRRIALLNISLRSSDKTWMAMTGAERDAMRELFVAVSLDPAGIASGTRPAALVDVIHSGETFRKLFELLFAWAAADAVDVRAVRRRLRVVGITWNDGHDRACRWRALDWATQFRPAALKGVAVPSWFWSRLGDSEAKVSPSNPPDCWTEPAMALPPRREKYFEGLRLARALYEVGRTRVERDALAAAVTEGPAVRHAWCRVLAAELRAASRPKRVERLFVSKRRVRSWRR